MKNEVKIKHHAAFFRFTIAIRVTLYMLTFFPKEWSCEERVPFRTVTHFPETTLAGTIRYHKKKIYQFWRIQFTVDKVISEELDEVPQGD